MLGLYQGVIKLLVTRNPCSVLNCSNCRCACFNCSMTISLCPSAVCRWGICPLTIHCFGTEPLSISDTEDPESNIMRTSFPSSFPLTIVTLSVIAAVMYSWGFKKRSGYAGALATIPIPFSDGCCLQLRAI